MSTAGCRNHRLSAAARALALGIVVCDVTGAAAAAAATTPPTVAIKVPAKVHHGEHFTIKITVTYDKQSFTTTPYLVAYVQFTNRPCQPTAKAEHALPTLLRTLDFAGKITSSPFVRTDDWKGGGAGNRRVCTWLYPKPVTPQSSAKPTLTANKSYRNV
jgi:hypothetical protein